VRRVKGRVRPHVGLREDPEVIAEIDAMAARRGVTRSEMVRRLTRVGLGVYRKRERAPTADKTRTAVDVGRGSA
jgi:metal-responsive CopG/Arc/MetJ family transcriptional regulator